MDYRSDSLQQHCMALQHQKALHCTPPYIKGCNGGVQHICHG